MLSKIRYMKKVGMGLVHYFFMIAVVLFLIVSLSSCNASGNVVLNVKAQIIEKMKEIHVPTGVNLKSDTSKVEDIMVDTTGNTELTGDFRYDNLFK